MKKEFPLLLQLFSQKKPVEQLTESEWDLVIRQARAGMLLARLYHVLNTKKHLSVVPKLVMRHLESAKVHAEKQQNDLLWEVRHIAKVADKLDFPVLLLKGAAYAIGGYIASEGRIFSDIDLLVPKKNIADAEKQLMLNGWLSSNKDAYDQRYYRQWMHEIPPLVHMFRGSVIDLHHNILPITTSACPNADLFFESAQSMDKYKNIKILSSVDLIIHSAVHLFYDGELDHGCRDLVDLDALMREVLGQKQTNVNPLSTRAEELGLQRAVFYAIRYTSKVLNTPVMFIGGTMNTGRPNKFILCLMDFLFLRALMPDHASCNDLWTSWARWLLYIRSHWLRMPMHLLIPHLLRKSWIRFTGKTAH
ncbi:MAG: nucleotidyltransferase family protein [Methylococcaceae bacterium]|nr:nucleotidyltransferase family protein [Methylococcaceae bacterium]